MRALQPARPGFLSAFAQAGSIWLHYPEPFESISVAGSSGFGAGSPHFPFGMQTFQGAGAFYFLQRGPTRSVPRCRCGCVLCGPPTAAFLSALAQVGGSGFPIPSPFESISVGALCGRVLSGREKAPPFCRWCSPQFPFGMETFQGTGAFWFHPQGSHRGCPRHRCGCVLCSPYTAQFPLRFRGEF